MREYQADRLMIFHSSEYQAYTKILPDNFTVQQKNRWHVILLEGCSKFTSESLTISSSQANIEFSSTLSKWLPVAVWSIEVSGKYSSTDTTSRRTDGPQKKNWIPIFPLSYGSVSLNKLIQ